jgi:hypothetical protein
MVRLWRDFTTLHWQEYRGDQDTLTVCCSQQITPLPPEWNARFFDESIAQPRIIHWCGERGKELLRKRLAEAPSPLPATVPTDLAIASAAPVINDT